MPGQLRGAEALEVGAGEVVEDQIALQSEQVPEAVEEMLLEFVLQRQQGVEGAVPALQLEGLDLDAGVLGGGALGVRRGRPGRSGGLGCRRRRRR